MGVDFKAPVRIFGPCKSLKYGHVLAERGGDLTDLPNGNKMLLAGPVGEVEPGHVHTGLDQARRSSQMSWSPGPNVQAILVRRSLCRVNRL